MFNSQNLKTVIATFTHDPAADDVLQVFRAPAAAYVTGAYAAIANDVNAGTVNYFSISLRNGGAAGTATTALAAAVGGTVGWTGLLPKTFTVSAPNLAAGDVVTAVYDEEGTGTYGALTIQIDYILGDM